LARKVKEQVQFKGFLLTKQRNMFFFSHTACFKKRFDTSFEQLLSCIFPTTQSNNPPCTNIFY